MRVFVLCTGRCGSMTFIKACGHITNFTAGHESRVKLVGDERLNYPDHHIEADNRLSWLLGRLDRRFGDEPFYVHLRRDPEAVAQSYNKRWHMKYGITTGYRSAILMGAKDADPLATVRDLVETVNANIELFLKDKTRRMTVSIESAQDDFTAFWNAIGAEGDLAAALNEWKISYNVSQKRKRIPKKLPEPAARPEAPSIASSGPDLVVQPSPVANAPVARQSPRRAGAAYDDHPLVESIRFPLGFLFCESSPRFKPPHFLKPFPDVELHVHPKTRVTRAEAENGFVVLMGLASNCLDPAKFEAEICQDIARALSTSEAEALSVISAVAGRFAVLYRKDGHTKILNDAVGLRSIYYGHDSEALCVASHATLVQRNLPQSVARPARMISWGHPGVITPFTHVYVLTPNTRFNITERQVERYYPTAPVAPASYEEAAEFVRMAGRNVLDNLLRRQPLTCSLTAGIDSRTSLALALPVAEKLRFFTYRVAPDDVDVTLSEELARTFELNHVVCDPVPLEAAFPDPGVRAAVVGALRGNSFYRHKHELIPLYIKQFGQWQHIHVRSNVYEIGRASFQKHTSFAPDTPAAATEFYLIWGHYNPKLDREFIEQAFEDMWQRSMWNDALRYWNGWDLYFWEHRMPTWQANVVAESDCAFETAVLVNSRMVLEKLIGVPSDVRRKNTTYLHLMETVDRRLLQYPFNPRRWPRTPPVVSKPSHGAESPAPAG